MKLTGFNIFRAGVFATRGGWANADNFCDQFKKYFSGLPYDKTAVIEKIDLLIESSGKLMNKIGGKEAEWLLEVEDLRKVKNRIEKMEFGDIESELTENFLALKKITEKFGIKYGRPMFIVNHFPKPYDFFDKTATTGTNFDDADNKIFGLVQGIYLKEESLNPYISTFVLAHELIHSLVSLRDCNYLARGLEEGFTQFFGEIFLCSKIYGFEPAKNHVINWRFYYPFKNQRKELYSDWLRQGCVFYQKFGISGMVELIKQGRGAVKRADELMLRGRLSEIDLPKGGWSKGLDEIAEIILSFNRDMVYGPLAVYMAQNFKKGENINELISRLNIKKTEGIKALKELNERIFSVLANDDKITIDDTKLYLRANNFRYEIHKTNK